jgi:4,5-dihydroxyphthalate decarboxylase
VVREVYRLLRESKCLAGAAAAGARKDSEAAIDFLPFGVSACRPALQTIIGYALQQSLIPRKIAVEELFDETTRELDG